MYKVPSTNARTLTAWLRYALASSIVARVVVEGKADLATGERAEGGGRRAERKRGNPALKSLRNALWVCRHEVVCHGQEAIQGPRSQSD